MLIVFFFFRQHLPYLYSSIESNKSQHYFTYKTGFYFNVDVFFCVCLMMIILCKAKNTIIKCICSVNGSNTHVPQATLFMFDCSKFLTVSIIVIRVYELCIYFRIFSKNIMSNLTVFILQCTKIC